MKLLLSTSNEDKTHELKSLLEPLGHTVYTLKDYGLKIRVEAKGITFFQNALLKAQAVSKVVDIPVLGDESGLVVPALNGEPGVYSARYAGEIHNNVANIQLLLRKMENITDREAYMQTVLVLMYPDGQYYYGEGSARGSITRSRRGFNGFGYERVLFAATQKDFCRGVLCRKAIGQPSFAGGQRFVQKSQRKRWRDEFKKISENDILFFRPSQRRNIGMVSRRYGRVGLYFLCRRRDFRRNAYA